MDRTPNDSFEQSRVRRGFPKSRGGCSTCKKRRVKCDETKPTCNRCKNTGWICDGYPELPLQKPKYRYDRPKQFLLPRTTRSIENSFVQGMALLGTSIDDSLDVSAQSSIERRLFSYFLDKVSPLMRGDWCSLFWSKFVPQVSSSEKAIQHGIIAVASLHEATTQGLDTHNSKNSKFVLLQYTKAISTLRKRDSMDLNTIQITLLACIIFSYVEMMRGNQEIFESHVRNGLKVLASYTRRYKLPSVLPFPPISISPNLEQTVLHNTITNCFKHSLGLIMWSPLGSSSFETNIPVSRSSVTEPFASMFEAKDSLNEVLSYFMKVPEIFSNSEAIESNEGRGTTTLSLRLQEWTTKLLLFMHSDSHDLSPGDMRTLRLLHIQSLIMRIWGAITTSGTQMTFDDHLEDFSTILSISSQIIDAQSGIYPENPTPSSQDNHTHHQQQQTQTDRRFSPSLCPIFALEFVAVKCRSPNIRRRALNLMKQVQPQVQQTRGVRVTERVSRYIMDFEERQCVLPVSEHPSTWPAESRRIHTWYFLPFSDGLIGEGGPKVMFVWQPGGRGTSFKNWVVTFKF